MTGRPSWAALFEFDAFSAAVASTEACGALSVIEPWLVAPTATLAAIALAAWMSLAQRRGSFSRKRFRFGPALVLVVLGTAAVVFLVPPPVTGTVRGLILAVGLVPLFILEKVHRGSRPPRFSDR